MAPSHDKTVQHEREAAGELEAAHRADELLGRIKALMTCSSLRRRLLSTPSTLLVLVKALSGYSVSLLY
jgi:hypothetical protein